MIGSVFSKLFGKKKKQSDSENLIDSKVKEVKEFANRSLGFFGSLGEKIFTEYRLIVSKCKNLLDTNYELGLKHLEAGNLNDAIFRFRFIKKFWPEFYEGQYRLAFCLVLKEKYPEAQQILEELLQKDPENKDALNLLTKINNGEFAKEAKNKLKTKEITERKDRNLE